MGRRKALHTPSLFLRHRLNLKSFSQIVLDINKVCIFNKVQIEALLTLHLQYMTPQTILFVPNIIIVFVGRGEKSFRAAKAIDLSLSRSLPHLLLLLLFPRSPMLFFSFFVPWPDKEDGKQEEKRSKVETQLIYMKKKSQNPNILKKETIIFPLLPLLSSLPNPLDQQNLSSRTFYTFHF